MKIAVGNFVLILYPRVVAIEIRGKALRVQKYSRSDLSFHETGLPANELRLSH
jgi:hypothetical protein